MIAAWSRHPVRVAVVAFFAGVLVVAIIWTVDAVAMDAGAPRQRAGATSSAAPIPQNSVAAPSAGPHPVNPTPPGASSVRCPATGTRVSTADALVSALKSVKPGGAIILAPGRYTGNFATTVSGTTSAPITLCGPRSAILDGGEIKRGYVFHLDGASYWRIQGFSVTNGQKGVVTDEASGNVIQSLSVYSIGDEGIHLRDFSSANLVTGNVVTKTGLLKPKFGEGIYVGTAKSNWCSFSQCKVDKSDHNTVSYNTISYTGAESVDIKEGTSFGILAHNTFNGSGMTGGDSWVDVKGDHWTIEFNSGKNSPNDGFQTHQIVDGQGTDNVFESNTADVNGPGFGYSLTPVLGNVVECNNSAAGAKQGLSNVKCGG